ncbi:MAG TPA: YihY/virulence factor BrkB family protein [Pirellulaceae bacterium]|nr:YihY/virulence factor BrkB family protein [Pirellulaceae bacterium]
MWKTLSETVNEFLQDECPRLAAALAYYAIFSLPALLVVVISIAGLVVNKQAATDRLIAHVSEAMGPRTAENLQTILDQAHLPGHGLWGSLVGAAVLLVGASGVLLELQTALNRAWGVQPDPKQSGWRAFVLKRVLSLGMLLGVAFLLLTSLVASWLLAEFGQWIDAHAPAGLSSRVIWALNAALSLSIITLLFAAILKFLPDAKIAWSDVWAGALATSVLFVLGKFGLGLYFAWADPTSAFGAAGSLALLLLWIYYSAMILFFGAEFTQVLARQHGKRVVPEAGAAHLPAASSKATA